MYSLYIIVLYVEIYNIKIMLEIKFHLKSSKTEKIKLKIPPIMPINKIKALINNSFFVISSLNAMLYTIIGMMNYREIPQIDPIIFKNIAKRGIIKAPIAIKIQVNARKIILLV